MQDAKNNSLSEIGNGKIVILTQDYYLFLGLSATISSLAPELLSKTCTLFDVIHIQELHSEPIITPDTNENSILITDYDLRLCSSLQLDALNAAVKHFQGVAIITGSADISQKHELCIAKRADIAAIRSWLIEIIYRVTTGRAASPRDVMNLLTPYDISLINLLMHGHRPNTIAEMLETTVKSVYAHRSRIYKKTGVKSLQELYSRLQNHWLP